MPFLTLETYPGAMDWLDSSQNTNTLGVSTKQKWPEGLHIQLVSLYIPLDPQMDVPVGPYSPINQ